MAEAIILGNIKEGVQGAMAQAQAARYNAMQMKFAAHQSNTAYQRTMADMSLAGLNPMLAHGATPAGGMSPNSALQVQQAETGAGTKLGPELAQLQIDRARARADIGLRTQETTNAAEQKRNIEKQREVLEQDRLNKVQERGYIEANTAARVNEGVAAASNTARNMAEATRLVAETERINSARQGIEYENKRKRNEAIIEEKAGPWLQGVERGARLVNPLFPLMNR